MGMRKQLKIKNPKILDVFSPAFVSREASIINKLRPSSIYALFILINWPLAICG
jgi:hypothetical protein